MKIYTLTRHIKDWRPETVVNTLHLLVYIDCVFRRLSLLRVYLHSIKLIPSQTTIFRVWDFGLPEEVLDGNFERSVNETRTIERQSKNNSHFSEFLPYRISLNIFKKSCVDFTNFSRILFHSILETHTKSERLETQIFFFFDFFTMSIP